MGAWDFNGRVECSHGVDTRPACWRCVNHVWVHGGGGGMPYYECTLFPKRLTLCDHFRDKWPACVSDAKAAGGR